ncbi:MAG: DUF2027 domain-containing protein, partial [Prolixibacteraceae bacterium]
MIKVGDKVKFLNDVGGGIVTGFINKNVVSVENEDGFEIPYPVSKLINESAPELSKDYKGPKTETFSPETEMEAEKPEIKAEGKIIAGKDSPEFFFCFVPTDPKNPLAGEIELYLVNDSNFKLLFHYSHFEEARYITVHHGTVQPNSKLKLESLVQSELSELPDYCFQLIYFKDEQKEWYKPMLKKFKINPVKFYKEKSYHSNFFFERNAMILQISENLLDTELDKLTDEDFTKVVKQKEPKPEAPKVARKQVAEVVEVDLHIQELIDNPAGLSNREILDIQLEKVKSEMQAAIQSGTKRIIF